MGITGANKGNKVKAERTNVFFVNQEPERGGSQKK